MLILSCSLTYWAGASYGLMVSILIPKMELAMAMVPVIIIPLMVLGGFFVNSNNIPVFLIWVEYISMFKWGF
jgi:ATP-binding cassette subfamily G (WHITE) protein 1